MGNNTVCKTVGIGNIRMRMFNGQIRTLTNVRHVSDLKKSLFSLGALEALRCKFLGADGGIKVTLGLHDDSQKKTDYKFVQDVRKHYYW